MSTLLTLAGARSILPGEVLRSPKVTGLALHGNATSATWKLRYVTKGGRERRPKLGTYPALSIEAAERAARILLEQVAAGKDPGGDWQLSRESATVNDLCDRFEKWVGARKKGQSLATDKRLLKKYIRAGLGRERVRDVTIDMVDTFLIAVHDRDPKFHTLTPKEHMHRAITPSQASRVRAVLSTMFTLAETRFKLIDPHSSPVRGAVNWQAGKRRRYASADELPRVFEALQDLKAQYPRQVAAILTLFFTGARVSEIAKAQTAELVHGDRLVLHNHKTVATIGPKTIYLPDVVVSMLKGLPGDNSGYVFGGTPLRWVWEKARTAAGCTDLQLKDARRTFASVGLSDGSSLDAIGKHFGHTNTKTTDGYSWLLEEAARTLVGKTAQRMGDLMKG